MPNKTGGVVLRNPCALTLGDEPLAGGVEHGPLQLRMEATEVGIALHDTIHAEIREQPTRRWQSSIQQPFQHPMQWHFSLCSLGLQQANPVWPDTNKPPQVALDCDVLRHEPADLPRAHPCQQSKQECTVQHPVLSI